MVKSKKRKKHFNILDQWVEITRENGVTRTELYPPNDVLLEEGRQMDPPPLLVYRRLNFLSGVPSEYGSTRPDAQHAAMAAVAYSA